MPITLRGSRLIAPDAGANDQFGFSVALSTNGLVLAIGAPTWDGTYGDQGAVYIYDWSGSAWVQRGTVLLAGDADTDDRFGSAVALSDDGTVLAVGSPRRNVASYADQGAVYIYDWSGSAWVQRGGIITAAFLSSSQRWGASVSLSGDGSVLAFGAENTYGVEVYDYSGSWTRRGSIAASFGGGSVALDSSGDTIAIGAPAKSTSFSNDGAAYIYDWSGSAWVLRGSQLLAPDPANQGRFGAGVALSDSASVLVVGAYNYAGVAADYRGCLYIYDYTGSAWVQRGDKLTSSDSIVGFFNPALSGDASVLVVGGPTYDDTGTNQGAVYIYDVLPDDTVSAPTLLVLEASTGIAIAPTSLLVTNKASAPTALTIINPSGTASAPTRLTLTASGTAAAATVLALLPAGQVPHWTLRCVIDGVDVSSTLTGRCRVLAEEGAARLADLTLGPASGALEPLDYVGKSITLDYVAVVAGTPVPMRIFTGRIDTPRYDFESRTLALSCVDDLQNRVAALPRTTLDLLIGGRYSTAVQGEILDGWDYAQARLASVPASLDAGAHGDMRVTSWESSTVWRTFGAGEMVFARSLVEYPQRSGIVNQVACEFDYRYPRLRQRYTAMGWSGTQIDIAPAGWQYPSQQDILGAASGSGWTITHAVFYPAPASIPHGSGGFIIPAEGSVDMAILKMTQRHSQTITEHYEMVVSAPESVAQNGTLPSTLRGALQSEFDGQAWESALDVPPLMPTGGEQDYAPDAPRTDAEYAMQTLLDMAQTRILGSHRSTRVSNAVPCLPDLDLDKRVAISTPELSAVGKVVRVEHMLDMQAGTAITSFSIASFAAGGAGIIAPDTLVPPPPPAPAVEAQDWPAQILSLTVNTDGITSYSESLMGLLLNPPEFITVENVPPAGDTVSYPNPFYVPGSYPVEGFRVQMPGVDDADRNPADKQVSSSVQIIVPADALTINIP